MNPPEIIGYACLILVMLVWTAVALNHFDV